MLLSNQETQAWKAAQLELILGTKGPLAHRIFVQCLDEEDSHPTHHELCSLFISHESSSETDSALHREVLSTQRKHKIDRYTVKPPNRGHFWDGPFVPCREVVLFSEVLF